MKNKIILISILSSILLNSCYIGRFIFWNFADINDYKKFQKATIEKPETPFHFIDAVNKKNIDSITWNGNTYELSSFLKEKNSVSFLIIRNDSILYEQYFDGYDSSGIVPSFSASKSIVSALVGIAVGEGYIKNVNQPITDFFPELNKETFGKITIEHLLNMRSGIQYSESYFNPFGNVAKGYYGRNLAKKLKTLKTKEEPDKHFDYVSYNTQLLGFIVERATGKRLAEYLEEKLWKPMGMEFDASWSIDSKKHNEVKAFCCLNARARDFAKFGRLYLNNGNWNGKQLIPEEWVKKSTTITKDSKDSFYSYQWWHNIKYQKVSDTATENSNSPYKIIDLSDGKGKTEKYRTIPQNDFLANGFLGQFIYVYPAKNIIIVRLGSKSDVYWPRLFLEMAKKL
jgi:CubicO group peptidase (beta-lactamase class C family)